MGTLINKNDLFFVAGHGGMAGSAICRALQRSGYKNLLTANRNELNLLNLQAVQKWFAKNKPTVVVLAAAKVGGIHANNLYPADFLLENLKIQNNVIETAWQSGVRRLLFLGSSCIYPKFAEQPIKEESLLTGSLEPTNEWYAIAKIAGIKLCESLRKQYDFDAISLMPTNLYGPGDNYHPENSHVLPALIRRFHEAKELGAESVTCWGTGTPMREFLHVDDLGDACVFSLENWSLNSSNAPTDETGRLLPYLNVGTGSDLSIKQLSELIAEKTGFMGVIHWDKDKPDGTPKKQLDVGRLTKLGWKSKISLDKGLTESIDCFKSQLKDPNSGIRL
ncbi:GDP-L-fucose synthase [Synechococcus sp. A15-62]|uniref:GDP-L-fucose synthase family protein n=1 Tax=Synechococcus sp. A15-62 TaxID=1050657 RepID=UPI001647D5FA|nr:GDP-L-fucose synthase [Synechococcus sp. A15-62]QNI99011.1 GDP-L-fucose synthase [Synechococcus sp. A15-62]